MRKVLLALILAGLIASCGVTKRSIVLPEGANYVMTGEWSSYDSTWVIRIYGQNGFFGKFDSREEAEEAYKLSKERK